MERDSKPAAIPSPSEEWRGLRLVRRAAWDVYRANTRRLMRVGNVKFAAYVRRTQHAIRPDRSQSYVLYHSWLPGFVTISRADARLVQRLVTHGVEAGAPQRTHQIANQLRALGWATGVRVDIGELTDRTVDRFYAIQNLAELKTLLRIVEGMKPRIVVEIGTARGGVLYALSQIARPDATLISIDLPGAPNCGGQTPIEREVFASFGFKTQTLRFIPSNSQYYSTYTMLLKYLAGRRIDLLFIDGDHSYGGVRSDLAMYGPLVSKNGVIALHDITTFPDASAGFEVSVVWKELKKVYVTKEIVDRSGGRTCRDRTRTPAWGIGLLLRPKAVRTRTNT